MYQTVNFCLNDSCHGSVQQKNIHRPWVLILFENNVTEKKRFALSLGILLSKMCFRYKLLLLAVSTVSRDETAP